MTNTQPIVAVCVVTHNSADDLPACLVAIADLDYEPIEVVIVDCASTDDSVEIIEESISPHLSFRHLELDQNLGFAGGMNRALNETQAPLVLTLNPDAQPLPDFVRILVDRMEVHQDLRVGAVTGRLLRPESAGGPATLDACGMKIVPTWRHLDRGSGSPDEGQWEAPERVFGATGAACLYRREALDDVAFEDGHFAREFHTYREDAELSFRLRERGWEILYEPEARCFHRRTNVPRLRRTMPPEINYHSLKNRYLLRAYHQDLPNFFLTLIPATWRDLLAITYALFLERTSLPAFRWLWNNRQRILKRRRWLRSRRTCDSKAINRWFWRRSLPL